MGKSTKKSTPKVDVAPAVVPPSKSTIKGKREAEGTVEKQVVAKKQKRDVGVEQALQKQKNETKTKKTQKKKEQSSSSEESSDSEEEQKVQVAKKSVVAAKLPAKESSSEKSSSDEETTVNAVTPLKKLPAAAKSGTAKKGKQDSSSDSSEIDSDEDEEPKSKVTAPSNKLPAPAVKNGLSSKSKKKAESSDDSDDEEMAKVISKKLLTAGAKNVESSDDSDSDETDSDEEDPKVSSDAGKPIAKTVQKESNYEEDSDESSDDDSTKKQLAKKPAQVLNQISESKKDSSKEQNSEEESEEEEPSRKEKKTDTGVEMVDAVSPKANTKQADSTSEKKAPKTPATSGTKTLYVGNLSYQVERDDVENFFKEAGEVVDVRFSTDAEGRFKGYGHVEFATAEAAQNALKLNGKELYGRVARLDLAREKGSYTPSGKESNSFQKGGRGQSQTLFVKGFNKAGGEDEIRSSLEEHFGTCGEISRVSIPKDFETGSSKGIAYIDFADGNSFNKALELNGRSHSNKNMGEDDDDWDAFQSFPASTDPAGTESKLENVAEEINDSSVPRINSGSDDFVEYSSSQRVNDLRETNDAKHKDTGEEEVISDTPESEESEGEKLSQEKQQALNDLQTVEKDAEGSINVNLSEDHEPAETPAHISDQASSNV